jgi:PAS domain S-box-containing protein
MQNEIEKTIKNNQIKTQLIALIPLLVLLILAAGEITGGWMDTSSLNITFYIVIFIAIWIVIFYFLEIRKISKLRAKMSVEDEILSETLNSLDEGVITTDLDGIIQSMNPKAERLTLWKENHAVGMPLEKVFDASYEDVKKPFTNVARRVLKNQKPIQYENHTVLRKRNAEQIAISNSGFPIWDRKNKMIGSVLVFRDITENISLTKENAALTERLLLATQSTGIGIWEWDILHDKLIWDENMHQIYNIPKTDQQSIYGLWNENIHAKDKARVFQELEDALNGNMDYHSEFRIHWQDGSIHYIKTKGVVERNEKGLAVKMVGASWDVTVSRKRESDVRRSDAFIRGVMNSLYTQVAVIDQRGLLIATSESWNKASNGHGDKIMMHLHTGSNYFT